MSLILVILGHGKGRSRVSGDDRPPLSGRLWLLTSAGCLSHQEVKSCHTTTIIIITTTTTTTTIITTAAAVVVVVGKHREPADSPGLSPPVILRQKWHRCLRGCCGTSHA